MVVNNNNLIQEVQTLNQALDTSNTQTIQSRISNRLFWLFDNSQNIILNEEFLVELERTGNLSNLPTRITTTIQRLVQTAIQVNGTDIANTVITPANVNTVQNIQTQIDAINNNYLPPLTNLPTQIQTLRNRLTENRQNLIGIRNTQQEIANINGTITWVNTIAGLTNEINILTNEQNICRTLGSNFRQRRSEKNRLTGLTDATQQAQCNANIQSYTDTIDTTITNDGALLNPVLLQSINTNINFEIPNINDLAARERAIQNLIDTAQAQVNARNNLQTQTQNLTDATGRLNQWTIPIPQNLWLNLLNIIIDPATINGGNVNQTTALIAVIDTELAQLDNLEAAIPNIRQRHEDNRTILENLLPIQRLQEDLGRLNFTPWLLGTRGAELQQIINLGQQTLRLRQANFVFEVGQFTLNFGGTQNPINLDTIFTPNGLPVNTEANYALCDTNGQELRRTGNELEAQTAGGQNVRVRWLNIENNANINELIINNIELVSTENITFPAKLSLNVRVRIQDPATGINIDHFKPLTLTINAPQIDLAERGQAYDDMNQNNEVNQRITAEYSNRTREEIENDVIWEILRANGNEEEIKQIYDNEEHRNILIQRIRGIQGLIPVFNQQGLVNGFRQEMTRLNREVPMQNLVSVRAFTDYLRRNLAKNVRDYVREQIHDVIDTWPNRNEMIRTLMNFDTDRINSKVDNNDHMRLNAAIPNTRPQARSRRWRQRLFGIRSQRNTYMKFFEGREWNMDGQTFEAENGPIKYDIKVNIPSAEKIVVSIKIEGEDEPLIIEWRDNNEMVNMILTRTSTKSWEPLNRKLRCHLALNAMKILVQKAPTTMHRESTNQQIIDINGRPQQVDRVEARMRGENLIVRWAAPVNQLNRQRTNHVIFDERRYKSLHNIVDLERGMIELSGMLTDIMEANCEEYTNMTTGFWNSMRYMRYGTNFPLRGGRAKRLWGRIRYKEKDYKFDFTKSITAWGKTVNIGFEKNKLTVSWTYKGNNYEYKGANLGDILNNKMKGMRVFDGIELAIIEWVNESMIENLRKNTFIGPESFAVSDINQNKTGRVYFMDSAWDLSYLEIEDRGINPINGRNSARIPTEQLPPQRVRCNEKERKEFMQNPALGGRLVREMRLRLSLF